jgi:hypothetical protein
MKSSKGSKCLFACAGAQLIALLALILGGRPIAYGQQITGSIVGTVKDDQGALVTAATVKATNLDTGFSQSTATDSDGVYRSQYLPVGRYNVEVEAPGFKKFVQENLVLTIDQTQALNVTLAIGVASQTVTVTEAPPLVNTTTAELGRTVQPAEITGLPLVNRNVYAQISLTPGVQANSASGNANGTPNFVIGVPSTQVVVNGGIDAGVPMVGYYLDGGINMTGLRNYGNQLPNPDALQEFRVETSNFSAQYGRMSSAVVTAITRSGTNRFHGSLFEFNRNTDLNATPWNSTLKAPYHRNQFGGTVGGPVLRDKAFFFFSYGGLRQTVGQQISGGVFPTMLERAGNFSQAAILPIDPTTGHPYDYKGTPGWIPPSDLDPTAANIISKFIPLPNSSNNTWLGYFTGPTNNDEYLGKYDQVLSTKDHLEVSYFTIDTVQNAYGGGNFLYSTNQSFARQQNVNISDIHAISPATANQAWFTFTRVAGGRVNLPATSIGDLGSSFTIQGASALPALSISGYFGAGGALAGPVSNTDLYAVRDLVSTTKGKHSLDYGAEISLEKDMFVGNLDNYGSFGFSTSTPGSTKNALADFVTGKVGSMEQDTPYHALLSTWYFPRSSLRTSLRLLFQASNPPWFPARPLACSIRGTKACPAASSMRGNTISRPAWESCGILSVTARPRSARPPESSMAVYPPTNGVSHPTRNPSQSVRLLPQSNPSLMSTGIQPLSRMETPSPIFTVRRTRTSFPQQAWRRLQRIISGRWFTRSMRLSNVSCPAS